MVLWRYRWRRLCFGGGGGFSLYLLESRRCRWRLIGIDLWSMAAVVSLLVASSVGFSSLSPLLSSVFCCRCWRFVVVGGGGVPSLGCFRQLRRIVVVVVVGISSFLLVSPYRRWSLFVIIIVGFLLSLSESCCRCRFLVVIAVSSLSEAASLLVADSVIFCRLLRLVVGFVIGVLSSSLTSLVVGGVLSFSSALASLRQRRRRSLVIDVVA